MPIKWNSPFYQICPVLGCAPGMTVCDTVLYRCAGKRLHEVFFSDTSGQEKQAITDRFVEECLKHNKLRHPNIVQLIGIYLLHAWESSPHSRDGAHVPLSCLSPRAVPRYPLLHEETSSCWMCHSGCVSSTTEPLPSSTGI